MYTLGGLCVPPRAALASVKPPSPCSPLPLAMDDFCGLSGEVLEPLPPLSKKRSGRGSKARSEQSMQTPAKGEQPLQLKLSARVTGRVCSCCGKDDRMSDLCQPQYRILWARYIKDDEGMGNPCARTGHVVGIASVCGMWHSVPA